MATAGRMHALAAAGLRCGWRRAAAPACTAQRRGWCGVMVPRARGLATTRASRLFGLFGSKPEPKAELLEEDALDLAEPSPKKHRLKRRKVTNVRQFIEALAVRQCDEGGDAASWDLNADLPRKAKFLAVCASAFHRDVPGPMLPYLQTVEEVIEFYESTPVVRPEDRVQFDAIDAKALPPNLHIVGLHAKRPR